MIAFFAVLLGLGLFSPVYANTPADAEATAFQTKLGDATKLLEPEPDPGVFDRLDAKFGEWVVGPLATVMFFDVWFWDNTIPLGAGIGRLEVPARGDVLAHGPHVNQVTHFEAGKGYVRQRLFEVPSVTPVLEEPLERNFGPVAATLNFETVQGKSLLMATIPEQDADLPALGLSAWDPSDPGSQPVVSVNVPGLGFPISVNRRSLKIGATEGVAPAGLVPTSVGSKVRAGNDEAVLTLKGGAEGAWRVMHPDVAHDREALPNPEQVSLPAVVAWLVFGALFFTIRMMFVNLRAFPHALAVTIGRYDDPDDPGEISHFQALSSALSATVGLGNIAGVAIAIGIGGPGAVFWLWVAGFLGMSSKFTECTLGQMYRVERADGSISGGPMHYLDKGFTELGVGPIGRVLAVLFALMCIGGSFGGGNMFQANQSFEAIVKIVPDLTNYSWLYGLMLMVAVGLVIVGGIKRIGAAASLVVPAMCGIYMVAGLYILAINASDVPAALATIVTSAFVPEAGLGGMVGVLAIGFQRASFSNEAGTGSASIAHSAATTKEPVREGVVALLEPFIDTILVCSVTALVVVLTGVKVPGGSGIGPTMDAFGSVLPWFPYVLAFAAMLFAFSTMVSWSYYGESAAVWLVGDAVRIPYRIVFLFFVFIGAVLKLDNVLTFSDLMILGMAFPNILGALFLSGKVKRALDTYLLDLREGRFSVKS